MVSGPDGLFKRFQRDQAVFLRVEISGFETFAFQFAERIQNGFMFRLDSDDVLALCLVKLGGAFQCKIIRFGRARRPDDFTRVGIDQGGNLRACFFNGAASASQPYIWLLEAGLPNFSHK